MITEKIGSYSLFVQGFRDANVTDSEKVLRDLRGSFPGVDLQLLRADRVAGREHNVFSARCAGASFQSKNRRGTHLSMERPLFPSGQQQILRALKLPGVTPPSRELHHARP